MWTEISKLNFKNEIMMKKLFYYVVAITITVGCGGQVNENIEVTICECQSLGDDYFELKMNASTEEEKRRLSKEELSKNMACAKLENSLGDQLQTEIDKCY